MLEAKYSTPATQLVHRGSLLWGNEQEPQAHARTRHGVFDTCHQHVVLLALVRLLRSQLSYAGLLNIKLTSFPVSTECVHEACQSMKDTRKYNHAKLNFVTGAFGAGLTTQYNL